MKPSNCDKSAFSAIVISAIVLSLFTAFCAMPSSARSGTWLHSGPRIFRFPQPVQAMALSPDSRKLLVVQQFSPPNPQDTVWGEYGSSVQLWSTVTGSLLWSHKIQGCVATCTFSVDGSRIVTVGGVPDCLGEIILWRSSKGTIAGKLEGKPIGEYDWFSCVVVSPNGRYIAAGGSGLGVLLDAHSGKLVHVLCGLSGQALTSVSFSADSSLLAAGSDDDTVRIWSVPDGLLNEPEALGDRGGARMIAWVEPGHPNLLTLSNGAMSIMRPFGPYRPFLESEQVDSFDISPNEDAVLINGVQKDDSVIHPNAKPVTSYQLFITKVYRSSKRIALWTGTMPLTSLCLTNTSAAASFDDGTVRVWKEVV